MNKFTELRRQLILRLIVFEYDLFGYLDIIETFLLGNLTQTQALGILGAMSADALKAVAKASTYFSYYSFGQMNMGGIGVRGRHSLSDSEPLKQQLCIGPLVAVSNTQTREPLSREPIVDIGGIGTAVTTRYCTTKSIAFTFKEQGLYLSGYGMVQPFGTSMWGTIPIYPKKWQVAPHCAQATSSVEYLLNFSSDAGYISNLRLVENPFALHGFVDLDKFCLNGFVYTTAPYGLLGKLNVSGQLLHGLLSSRDSLLGISSQTKFGFLFKKQAMTITTEVHHLGGEKAFSISLPKICGNVLPTTKKRWSSVKIVEELYGYIDITIVKNVSGRIGSFTIFDGALKKVDKEDLKGVHGIELNGASLTGVWKILDVVFGHGQLFWAPQLFQPKLSIAQPMSTYTELTAGALLLSGFAQRRAGEQVMGIVRNFVFKDGIGVVSLPSYQAMVDMFGLFAFDTNIDFACKGEGHVTLTYDISFDEEAGEIYNIQSNYHTKQDDITYIGWRYIQTLIE